MELSDLSATQIANALAVYRAAIPYGPEAAEAALMAAGAESSYLLYANNGGTTRDDVPAKWRALAALSMQLPHDATAGQAWTTADLAGIGELMDPAESTRIFVRGSHGGSGSTRYFLQSPTDKSLAQRVQWTQGSEFPTGENYEPFTTVVKQLMARFRATEPAVIGTVDLTDWIITMADQNALDEQWDRIADKVAAKVWDIEINPDIMALHNRALFAQDTGQGSSFANQFALILARLERIEKVMGQQAA